MPQIKDLLKTAHMSAHITSVGKNTFKTYSVTEYMLKNVICNVFRYITQSEERILNTWITSTLNCIL